jgi:hypothetical protein
MADINLTRVFCQEETANRYYRSFRGYILLICELFPHRSTLVVLTAGLFLKDFLN